MYSKHVLYIYSKQNFSTLVIFWNRKRIWRFWFTF